MGFATTGKTRIRSDKCCVLFDPASGTIRHVHRVVTMEGADVTPERDVERRARTLAKDLGTDAANLKALLVDSESIKPGKPYAVDPKKRTLVSLQGAKPKTARRVSAGERRSKRR
jgi:hypothetical protein